jgi:hypothetical protein
MYISVLHKHNYYYYYYYYYMTVEPFLVLVLRNGLRFLEQALGVGLLVAASHTQTEKSDFSNIYYLHNEVFRFESERRK